MLINSNEARIVGKNAYVNGYKFVNGKWKRKSGLIRKLLRRE